MIDYELNTVTYGVNCAPFLALRVLRAIADSDCESFPQVRDALCHQTYVDDICYGADTITDVVAVQSELNSVLARSGLELRKWSSNTPAVLQGVPADNCVVRCLFVPAIFLAKHIIQRTWQAVCEWDGPLPCDIHTDWAQFVVELPQLSNVRVPRFCNATPGSI